MGEDGSRYPETAYAILRSSAEGQLGDSPPDFKSLGLPGLSETVTQYQKAALAHDAATQTAVAANTLMTAAVMTGNPYVIAAAAIIVALMFIFGGGGGNGKGDGKGKGSGDEGQGTTELAGNAKAIQDSGKVAANGSQDSGPGQSHDDGKKTTPTGPGQTNVPGRFAEKGFWAEEGRDGSLTVSGGEIQDKFFIPKGVVEDATGKLTVGEVNEQKAKLVFKSWSEQYIESIGYDKAADVLTITLGNSADKLEVILGEKHVPMTTVTISFRRSGGAVTGKIERGAS